MKVLQDFSPVIDGLLIPYFEGKLWNSFYRREETIRRCFQFELIIANADDATRLDKYLNVHGNSRNSTVLVFRCDFGESTASQGLALSLSGDMPWFQMQSLSKTDAETFNEAVLNDRFDGDIDIEDPDNYCVLYNWKSTVRRVDGKWILNVMVPFKYYKCGKIMLKKEVDKDLGVDCLKEVFEQIIGIHMLNNKAIFSVVDADGDVKETCVIKYDDKKKSTFKKEVAKMINRLIKDKRTLCSFLNKGESSWFSSKIKNSSNMLEEVKRQILSHGLSYLEVQIPCGAKLWHEDFAQVIGKVAITKKGGRHMKNIAG